MLATIQPESRIADALWWVMHHSEDEARQAAFVECYLDESGTDDLSPTAVVGGLVLNRSGFGRLNARWTEVCKAHGLPSIHMKDFGRHGKHGRLKNTSSDRCSKM